MEANRMIDQNQAFNTVLWLAAMLAQTSTDLTATQGMLRQEREKSESLQAAHQAMHRTIADLEAEIVKLTPQPEAPQPTQPEADIGAYLVGEQAAPEATA
jgi:hypothetical protein